MTRTAIGYGLALTAWGVHLVFYPPVLAMAYATRVTFGHFLTSLDEMADAIEAEQAQEQAVAA